MVLERLMRFVSGLNPFKSQTTTATDSSQTVVSRQELEDIEKQHRQNLSGLLGIVEEDLVEQFRADREFTGAEVQVIIHSSIQRLTQHYIPRELVPDADIYSGTTSDQDTEKIDYSAGGGRLGNSRGSQKEKKSLTPEDIEKTLEAFNLNDEDKDIALNLENEERVLRAARAAAFDTLDNDSAPTEAATEQDEVCEPEIGHIIVPKSIDDGNPYYRAELRKAVEESERMRSAGEEQRVEGSGLEEVEGGVLGESAMAGSVTTNGGVSESGVEEAERNKEEEDRLNDVTSQMIIESAPVT